MRRVIVFDTTLRDGEQAPGYAMTPEDKLRLARQLAALGVDVIEAGFPAASEGDWRSVRDIAAEVRGPIIAALARCHERDIQLAGEALRSAARPRLHVFLATSDLHLAAKLRITRAEAIERIRSGVRQSRRFTDDVEFSAEDASRSDPDFLAEAVQAALDEGATTINLPDTVGYALPDEYGAMFRRLRARVPDVERATLSAHCHDDLGLAVANSLAAIANGATQVECTVNGIGERAGNAALEELVMAAHVRRTRLGYETGIVTTEIARTSQLLSYLTGHVPQPNKAIVGRNAFAHESGIHQHGMLADGATYEIMRPEAVGLARSRLVLGKHSGRHALARRLRDLGHDVDEAHLDAIYQRFSALADRKREILDEDLLMLVHESFGDVPEAFELERLDVHCGSVVPSAQVTLRGPWAQARAATGTGDGPIAAAFAAVSEIVGATVEVESLGLHSITPGRDSVGQVFLQASVDGRTFSAHGASTDIVEACVHALVNALNKARHAEHLEQAAHDATYLWGV